MASQSGTPVPTDIHFAYKRSELAIVPIGVTTQNNFETKVIPVYAASDTNTKFDSNFRVRQVICTGEAAILATQIGSPLPDQLRDIFTPTEEDLEKEKKLAEKAQQADAAATAAATARLARLQEEAKVKAAMKSGGDAR
ncbi:hypothetical protein GC173_07210 [bacterium]|nr:hypothetical protein [bacterium]